jgi:hypothetical protein
VTLATWSNDVWLALADRDGSYFGRLAEQGTLQRFNPLMDHEYELDISTGLFSAAEDARWARVSRGLRVAGASINHPFILNFADWKERLPISSRVSLLAEYRRQRSLTAQRDYPRLELRWDSAIATEWSLGAGIGMHYFKASADVELTAGRSWHSGRGRLSLDVRVALLDAFNNVIFNALGVEPEETDAHFDYRRLPLAARFAVIGEWPRARFEAHAGASNRSHVSVSFPQSGDPSYSLEERLALGGLLLQLAMSSRLSLAATATAARANTTRRFVQPTSGDFELSERTHALAAHAALGLRERLGLEAAFGVRWKPEDRTWGDGTRVRHRDREVWGGAALLRRPPAGWTWKLGYAFGDRKAGVLAAPLNAANHRQLMEWGYRFRSGFEVTAGLRWDLDQGLANPFDGGHLRLGSTW